MMQGQKLDSIIVRPENIFRDAESEEEQLYVLADCYADVRTWIAEDSESIAALKKELKELRREVKSLKGAKREAPA